MTNYAERKYKEQQETHGGVMQQVKINNKKSIQNTMQELIRKEVVKTQSLKK